MKMWNKKLLTVITEKRLEKEIIDVIKLMGAHGYTITDARGEGHRGVRSGSWEEASNIRIEVVGESEVVCNIAEKLQKNFYDNYAIILYLSEIQTIRNDKF